MITGVDFYCRYFEVVDDESRQFFKEKFIVGFDAKQEENFG
jgi:hypothetical protein